MIESLFKGTQVPILEQVVNFSQSRHALLVGNIANLDTPGYRARDLSPSEFAGRLKEAIEASRREKTHVSLSGVLPEERDRVAQVSDDLSGILRHDLDNVSLEQQVTEIAKNQMQHNLALTLLGHQFRQLQAAISERA